MKKVSVVLPVYNGEQSIEKAITSVLTQTYENLEIIVVNDCSTDGTKAIIEKYASLDSRVNVINNETNQKLPRSLNIGFRSATGDYLTWTSDDNQYHVNAIEKMVRFLDQNEDYDLVYTDFSVVYMDGTLREKARKDEPDKIKYINPVGACFLYRRELAERIGEYDPDMFLAEDYEYWIRAYLNGNLHHISEDLYDYGWHDKSLTSTRTAEIRKQTYKAKFKYEKGLLERCVNQDERNLFYWEQLCLIDDKKTFGEVRKAYYLNDGNFMKADRKKRVQDAFKSVMSIPSRVIARIKR
ncbi:glycosyltransferase family 2 protein [Butyrivibrio sp. INlla14]|uniref:glycosyltransferase family 2 protein n=1 Tax=Butyrivibrio sp. INlla14 TaxID=1520808 RepID=UPI0008774182|nr:glycosyltransferase family 2 protein [Butyrivibrio sp. INlla14]SCY70303.1 Glycosyl transferase family 2 [Butyrivibrio sp. INlla14]